MKEFTVDIETCPINLSPEYFELSDVEKLKLLNPIESRIVAIGIRYVNSNIIFSCEKFTEREMLEKFWEYFQYPFQMIGFNIVSFDLPFIVSRSLINDVKIVPINLKNDIIDIRDNINCFKYGQVRGKLKEYAQLLGLEVLETKGSDVAELIFKSKYKTLNKYLCRDIEITESIYLKCKELNILKIKRW